MRYGIQPTFVVYHTQKIKPEDGTEEKEQMVILGVFNDNQGAKEHIRNHWAKLNPQILTTKMYFSKP